VVRLAANPICQERANGSGIPFDLFSAKPIDMRIFQILQPNIEAYLEPHPFALNTKQISTRVGSNPDRMYLEEAMKQQDREHFIKAMYKELEDHIRRKYWVIVPLKLVPSHKTPLPMVWSMKRKCNPIGKITKWKATGHAQADTNWSSLLIVGQHTHQLLLGALLGSLSSWPL
jgi:hypothetical protein